MESEDKKKIHSPGHENHGVHVCHKCGWAFPNPHPSAKQRRAHKKVCGKVEGFKLTGSEEKTHSDSDLSDDDHKPQPASCGMDVKKSRSVGIEAEGPGRSEEDVFSDAVAEFGDAVSSRTVEENMSGEGIKGGGDVGHVLEMPTVADKTPQPNDALQSKLDNAPHPLHSATNAMGESILDKRADFPVEPTEDGSSAPFSSNGASHLEPETPLNDSIENKNIDTDKSVTCSMTSVGLDTDAKDNEKSNEDERVPSIAVLPDIPESGFAAVEVPSDLTNAGTITMDVSSEDAIMGLKEADTQICHVHEKQTGGAEQQKPLRELSSIQSGSMEAEADIGRSVETAQITKGSLPIEPSADIMQVPEDSVQVDRSAARSVHEELIVDQSSLGGNHSDERSQFVGLASTECAAEGIGLDGSAAHPDSNSAGPATTKATSLDDVTMGSSKIEATLVHSEENELHSGHDLSPEVMPATPTVLAAGGNIGDSAEEAEVHQAIAMDSGELDREEDSGHDLSHEVMPETPTVLVAGRDIADSAVEAKVHQAITTGSGELDGEKDSGHDLSHKVIPETPTVLVAGGNIAGSAVEAEVHQAIATDSGGFGREEDSGHDLSHEVMPETPTVPAARGDIADSAAVEAEVHQVITMDSGGLDGEKDFGHDLSHEVIPETPTVPVAGGNIVDSAVVTEAHQAIAMDSSGLGREEDSGHDPSHEVMLETPTVPATGVDVAVSAVEADVHHGIATESGGLDREEDSGHNLLCEVVLETPEVPAAGGNNVDSPVEAGHDLLPEVVPETPTVPAAGGIVADSAVEAEVHQAIAMVSAGLDVVCKDTRTDHTNTVGEYSKQGATDELSPSVIAIIPEYVTDESKVSSQYHEDLGTDKLEGNLQLAESAHWDAAVGSKGRDIDNGPLESISEPNRADHSDIEMEAQVGPTGTDSGFAEHHHKELKLDQSSEVGAYQLDVQNPAPKELVALAVGTESCVQGSAIVESCSAEDFAAGDASNIHDRSLPDEGDDTVLKQNVNASIMATDASVSSFSQDDSVEGHWGSVSDMLLVFITDIPTPKEASNASLKNASASKNHVDNTDLFEAPSFMTLVEPGKGDRKQPASSEIQSAQRPTSPSSQPGWFPSLTHVVNESQGRKKNEEIIAKVVNWSSGKPHTPLRSLLVEANLESKYKPLKTAQDHPSPTAQEDQALQDKAPPVKTTNPELPTGNAAKGEVEKEWNSPARLPVIKRERRKLRGWVPFVCCSSVN
ncbi:uncharacterized protein LOC131239647 isoform X2 [Magnolia sinica]|uniref:uncharacterized protein LOC131239647 isoform X2 n=1 Tax=Magnolia sinica TaxID=86752 RepID=UPI002658EB14|nr:uncharacterized protein LOC131239647 isoform X2 [Magnolia sinica]